MSNETNILIKTRNLDTIRKSQRLWGQLATDKDNPQLSEDVRKYAMRLLKGALGNE